MQSYVSDMSRSNAYGTFIELAAASAFYRFKSSVLCSESDDHDISRLKFINLQEEDPRLPTLHFVLSNRSSVAAHYWPCDYESGAPFDKAAVSSTTPEDEALNAERQLYWRTGCMGHNLSAGVALYVRNGSDQKPCLATKISFAEGNTVTAIGGYLCKV